MNYPELSIGDIVILGEHAEVVGASGFLTKNWSSDMRNFVGTKAIIKTESFLESETAIPVYGVDTNIYHWRVSNMQIIKSRSAIIHSAKPAIKSIGPTCSRCKEYYEYAEPRPNFICYMCKH